MRPVAGHEARSEAHGRGERKWPGHPARVTFQRFSYAAPMSAEIRVSGPAGTPATPRMVPGLSVTENPSSAMVSGSPGRDPVAAVRAGRGAAVACACPICSMMARSVSSAVGTLLTTVLPSRMIEQT